MADRVSWHSLVIACRFIKSLIYRDVVHLEELREEDLRVGAVEVDHRMLNQL